MGPGSHQPRLGCVVPNHNLDTLQNHLDRPIGFTWVAWTTNWADPCHLAILSRLSHELNRDPCISVLPESLCEGMPRVSYIIWRVCFFFSFLRAVFFWGGPSSFICFWAFQSISTKQSVSCGEDLISSDREVLLVDSQLAQGRHPGLFPGQTGGSHRRVRRQAAPMDPGGLCGTNRQGVFTSFHPLENPCFFVKKSHV